MDGGKLCIAALALLAAGCDNTGPSAYADKAEKSDQMNNPAGRYQMLPSPDGKGVVVLDTRWGTVSHCVEKENGYICGGRNSALTPQ